MGTTLTDRSQDSAHANVAAKYNLPAHFIGGNHLGNAAPSKVKDFVAGHGGHTVITNVSFEISWLLQISIWSRSYTQVVVNRGLTLDSRY